MYTTSQRPPVTRLGLAEQVPCVIPRIIRVVFRNQDGTTSAAANCCPLCQVVLPDGRRVGTGINLGVGQSGTASNGMEMQFVLSHHCRGLEYDVVRTRRNSLWERRNGAWMRLESQSMGTRDDRRDVDECLTPRNRRIFVEDRPGWNQVALPAPAESRFDGGTRRGHADATEVVLRASFAEWVQARSRLEGIPWTRLALPPRRDGTLPRHIYWHTITWLRRDAAGRWILDRARSRIRLGALSSTVIDAAPVP
jgi:hypothetical protein